MPDQVIMIVGLPGSGKTFLATQLVSDTKSILCDDVSKDITVLESLVDYDGTVILTDPTACTAKKFKIEEKIREYFDCPISFIAFENDPEQCWKNIQNRNDDRKISYGYLKHLSENYDVDQYLDVRPVYQR